MANSIEQKWTPEEIQFLTAHAADMSFKDLAQALGRSENAVRIRAHRERLTVNINGGHRRKVTFNVVKKMIESSVSALKYFNPDKEFYEKTGLTAIRFWGAARGEYPLQPDELRRLAAYLKLNLEDFQADNQMTLEF